MTNPLTSPFAAKPDDVASAAAIDPAVLAAAAAARQAQQSNAVFGTFRYEMNLSLLKGQLAKISTLTDGIQEEDLSANEDGTIDEEFELATVEALDEIEGEARKLLASVARFKAFIIARSR